MNDLELINLFQTKKMVYLKSYECHSCHNLCKEYASKGLYKAVLICVDCGYLICGKCRVSVEERKAKCEVTGNQCDFISYYTAFFNYLTQFDLDDELKLLNFGKWSPIISDSCCEHSITPKNKLAFVDSNVFYCVNCLPADKIPKQPPIDTYMKIINEFKGYFSEVEEHIVVRKGIQLESLKCTICKKNSRPICLSETAVLHCTNCKDKFEHSYEMRWPGICGIFNSLLRYIPDINDLKLLTYSKWTPLRCEQCPTVLSEAYDQLPMFHPDCRKIICNQCVSKHKCRNSPTWPIVFPKFLLDAILEFRALFKNAGVEEVPLEIKTIEKRNAMGETSLLSKYICANKKNYDAKKLHFAPAHNGGTHSFLPSTISCLSCSRRTDVTEARNCINCAMYGICSVCLMRQHWGHEIKDTEERMIELTLQHDAKSTLEKLTKWKGRLTDINAQGLTVQKELCDSYKCVYEKAMSAKDLQLVQAIRQENNNKMQKRVEDCIASHIRLNEEARALSERLQALNSASSLGTERNFFHSANSSSRSRSGAHSDFLIHTNQRLQPFEQNRRHLSTFGAHRCLPHDKLELVNKQS